VAVFYSSGHPIPYAYRGEGKIVGMWVLRGDGEVRVCLPLPPKDSPNSCLKREIVLPHLNRGAKPGFPGFSSIHGSILVEKISRFDSPFCSLKSASRISVASSPPVTEASFNRWRSSLNSLDGDPKLRKVEGKLIVMEMCVLNSRGSDREPQYWGIRGRQ
jgi:hypothetical protein